MKDEVTTEDTAECMLERLHVMNCANYVGEKKVQRLEVFVQRMDMAENSCCKESIREVFRSQIDELIERLFAFGEESFFMSAKVDESNLHVLGSEKGRAYIRQNVGVQKGFIPFLQEEQVNSAGNRKSSLICTAMAQKPICKTLTSRKKATGIYETNRFSTEKENEEVRQRAEQDDSRDLQDRSTETEKAIVDQTSLEGSEISLQEPTAKPTTDGQGERKLDIEIVPDIEISTISGGFQDGKCGSAQGNNNTKFLTNSSVPKPDCNPLEDTSLDCKGTTDNTKLSVDKVTRDNVVGGFSTDRDLEDADTDNVISIPNSRSVCFQNTRSTNSNNNCSNNAGDEHTYVNYNESRLGVMGEEENISGQETGYVTVTASNEQIEESDQSIHREAVPVSSLPSPFIVSKHNLDLSEGSKEIRPKYPKLKHTERQNVNNRGTETSHITDFPNTNNDKSSDIQPTLPQMFASTKNSFKCLTCHKTFKFSVQLNKHHCLEVAKYILSEKQTFSRENKDISNLKKSTSTKERKYTCHYCEKRFQAKSHLDEHEACIHTKEYMYKCSLCSEKFVQRSKFPKHRKTCQAKYPGKTCKLSKLNTTREKDKETIYRGIKNRENSHNASETSCSIQPENEGYSDEDVLCLMSIEQKSMLESIKASSTKAGDKLQCSKCGTLMRSGCLKSHIISTHLGRNLFACPFCEERFSFVQIARRHLRERCKERHANKFESRGNKMSVHHALPLTNKNETGTRARLSGILSDSTIGAVDSQENDNESVSDIFAEESNVDESCQEIKQSPKRGEGPLEHRTSFTGAFSTNFDHDRYNIVGLDDTERMGTLNASVENQLLKNDVSAVNDYLQDKKFNHNNVLQWQTNPLQINVKNNTDYYNDNVSKSDSDRESHDSDGGEYVETAAEQRSKPRTIGKQIDSKIIDAVSDVGTLRSCKRKLEEEEFTSHSKMGIEWNPQKPKDKNTAINVPRSKEDVVNLMTEDQKKEVENIKALSKKMDGNYQCIKCGKFFEHRLSSRLMEHIISCHIGEKMFECGACRKKFAASRNVTQHLKNNCKKKLERNTVSKGNSTSCHFARSNMTADDRVFDGQRSVLQNNYSSVTVTFSELEYDVESICKNENSDVEVVIL